jgi:protocatechuate 4,5-dioxygenase beta chain
VARITAGIATSHVPAIGAAFDLERTQEPQWKPVFDGYEWVRQFEQEEDPDVVILCYNDHASAMMLDVVPTFALGCAEDFAPADEGWGPRPVPMVMGDPGLSGRPQCADLGNGRHESPAPGAARRADQSGIR